MYIQMLRKWKYVTVGVFILVTLTVFQFVWDYKNGYLFSNKLKHGGNGLTTLDRAVVYASKSTKYIVDWCPYIHNENKKFQKVCGRCIITSNRSMIKHPDTGAVIFNNKCMQRRSMPAEKYRRPEMLYIWFNLESPGSTRRLEYVKLLEFEKKYFNATMTYRRDSSFVKPYHYVSFLHKKLLENKKTLTTKKYRMAVWIVSNCHGTNGAVRRMNVFRKLSSAGLKIDTFGRCFKKRPGVSRGTQQFYAFIAKYKFYLAFENSYHCRDYITEKFFEHGLSAGVVPVVWGTKKEDYETIAPPKSFIHVDDFKSPKDLVKYLKFLDKNDEEYQSYFAWRHNLTLTKRSGLQARHYQYGWCKMCRSLHGIESKTRTIPQCEHYMPLKKGFNQTLVKLRKTVKRRVIHSLYDWWYDNDDSDCTMPTSH